VPNRSKNEDIAIKIVASRGPRLRCQGAHRWRSGDQDRGERDQPVRSDALWGDLYYSSSTRTVIQKLSTAGGSATTIVTGQIEVLDIAADASGVYWSDVVGHAIRASDLSGGNLRTLASGVSEPQGVALDAVSVYFTDASAGTISSRSEAIGAKKNRRRHHEGGAGGVHDGAGSEPADVS
jgi:hypothetical protein